MTADDATGGISEPRSTGEVEDELVESDADDRDGGLIARPYDEPAPAATARARTRLQTVLQTDWGHSEQTARTIARSIANVEDALIQLKVPSKLGVHGATVSYITTRLRVGTVSPLPTNPRIASQVLYPAGGSTHAGSVEPLKVAPAADGSPALLVSASSELAIKRALEVEGSFIRDDNDLSASVSLQGVLLPITVVPTIISHADASAERVVMCSVDGSSRTIAVLGIHGLSGNDVVYRLDSDRELDALGRELDRIATTIDEAALTEEQRARLRNVTIPAQVIVGFSPYGDEPLDFAGVIDAYLGLLHVEPPKKWSDAAEQDARADAVLDEFRRAGRISSDEFDYLAGLLTPTEAVASGFDPHLDSRAAKLFALLARRSNANLVNRALRRIGMKAPTPEIRLGVATELAIRPYRLDLPAEQVRGGPRLALPQAAELVRGTPYAPAEITLEELRDLAVEEIGTSSVAARHDLCLRAAFWLTRYAALQKSSRADRRYADQLLRDIASSEYGVYTLYQSILDGRSGTHPRRVREDGALATNSRGDHLDLDDATLRREFPMTPDPGGPDDPDDPDTDPQDLLDEAVRGLRQDAARLQQRVTELPAIVDADGASLVSAQGVPRDITDEMSATLESAKTSLIQYGVIWAQRGSRS